MILQENLVSIVMPAFNAGATIEESVNSVIDQTYSNWELIIVNDGSKDNTFQLISDLSKNDDRIRIINKEQNEGISAARNTAISLARGRYLCFLDSDDLWKPHKLDVQISSMNSNPDNFFVCSGYELINNDSEIVNKKFTPPSLITFSSQLYGSKIGCLTVMIDRKIVEEVVMLNIKHEDYVAWQSILKKHGNAVGLSESLAFYRVGNDSVSSNKLKTIGWQYNNYVKYLHISRFSSLFYTVCYIFNGIFKYKWDEMRIKHE